MKIPKKPDTEGVWYLQFSVKNNEQIVQVIMHNLGQFKGEPEYLSQKQVWSVSYGVLMGMVMNSHNLDFGMQNLNNFLWATFVAGVLSVRGKDDDFLVAKWVRACEPSKNVVEDKKQSYMG